MPNIPEVINLCSDEEEYVEQSKSSAPNATNEAVSSRSSRKRPRSTSSDPNSRQETPVSNRLVILDTSCGDDGCKVSDDLRDALPSSSGPLHHVQQPDRWSCGYRNLQMLLFCTLPCLDSSHSHFQKYITYDDQLCTVPSLLQLQSQLEDAWRKGFDAEGAQHYNHRIVNKNEWIGAVEVSAILTNIHIDSALVQFIKCKESRRLLGPFCREYFGLIGPDSSQKAVAMARSCLEQAGRTASSGITRTASRESVERVLLPLYMQWQGHSITVVGMTPDNSSLLIMDPQRKQVTGKPFLVRPVSDFARKDVQLLLLSTVSMTLDDWNSRRNQVAHVTAAAEIVQRNVQN